MQKKYLRTSKLLLTAACVVSVTTDHALAMLHSTQALSESDIRPDSMAAYYRRQALANERNHASNTVQEQRDRVQPLIHVSSSTGSSAQKETPAEYRARHARIAEQKQQQKMAALERLEAKANNTNARIVLPDPSDLRRKETPAEYAARHARIAEQKRETPAEYAVRRTKNAEEKRQRKMATGPSDYYEDDYGYDHYSSRREVMDDDYDRPRGGTMHDQYGHCVWVNEQDMAEFRRRN